MFAKADKAQNLRNKRLLWSTWYSLNSSSINSQVLKTSYQQRRCQNVCIVKRSKLRPIISFYFMGMEIIRDGIIPTWRNGKVEKNEIVAKFLTLKGCHAYRISIAWELFDDDISISDFGKFTGRDKKFYWQSIVDNLHRCSEHEPSLYPLCWGINWKIQ